MKSFKLTQQSSNHLPFSPYNETSWPIESMLAPPLPSVYVSGQSLPFLPMTLGVSLRCSTLLPSPRNVPVG